MGMTWRLGQAERQGAPLAPRLVTTSRKDCRRESDRSHKVLVIDGNGFLRVLFEEEGHEVIQSNGAPEALAILETASVDMIVFDLPLLEGIAFAQRVRTSHRTQLTPMLMVAGCGSVEDEVAAISAGVDEYLIQPCHVEILRARVRRLLRHKAVVDRMDESETILMALAQTVEQRDSNTAGHCQRLALLSIAMGMAMDLPSDDLLALHRGGYLHDVGKIAIPDAVLLKRGPLTEAEWAIMRTHTIKGEEICRGIKCLYPVLPIIRSHHEHWDGTGYPDGLVGQGIPLLARVLQFADVYDALISTRSYKVAMTSEHALQVMQEETDRGWHDPELMQLFLRLRHDTVSAAAAGNPQGWQDIQVMRESLENLRSALLR